MVTTTAEAVAGWQDLTEFLKRWYNEPDPHALEIAVCTYVSHTYLSQDAVWLFIIGPSGTGKTGIVIKALSYLPSTHRISDLTSSTFLSGFGKGSKKYSLLHQLGPSHVILFKDFTTLLSKRFEDQKEIVAQLREIHDGQYSRSVGTSTKSIEWQGKMTVVAACTPALERAWSVMRELGDRFLAVRWDRGSGEKMAGYAGRQIGNEPKINSEMRERILALVGTGELKPAELPDEDDRTHLHALVEFVAQLRAIVIRDNRNEILAVDQPEGTSRLTKGILQLAQARATLMRRSKAGLEDIRRVQRAALDSIPHSRLRVVEAIPDGADATWSELVRLSGLGDGGPLQRPLDDLMAIGIVESIEGRAAKLYHFSAWFQALKLRAFPQI